MQNMIRNGLRLLAVLAVLVGVSSVRADSFDVQFFNTSGTTSFVCSCRFVTNPPSGGFFLVTAIQGSLNGTSIVVDAVGTFAGNDNHFLFPGPFADVNGVSFHVGLTDYNLYFFGGTYFLQPSTSATETLNFSAQVDPPGEPIPQANVPEPSSLELIGLGMLALGAAVYYKRKKTSLRLSVAGA